jgi:hypothetical protein
MGDPRKILAASALALLGIIAIAYVLYSTNYQVEFISPPKDLSSVVTPYDLRVKFGTGPGLRGFLKST